LGEIVEGPLTLEGRVAFAWKMSGKAGTDRLASNVGGACTHPSG
jgi:hypothetical protein